MNHHFIANWWSHAEREDSMEKPKPFQWLFHSESPIHSNQAKIVWMKLMPFFIVDLKPHSDEEHNLASDRFLDLLQNDMCHSASEQVITIYMCIKRYCAYCFCSYASCGSFVHLTNNLSLLMHCLVLIPVSSWNILEPSASMKVLSKCRQPVPMWVASTSPRGSSNGRLYPVLVVEVYIGQL